MEKSEDDAVKKLENLLREKTSELNIVTEEKDRLRLELGGQRMSFQTLIDRYDEQIKQLHEELYHKSRIICREGEEFQGGCCSRGTT